MQTGWPGCSPPHLHILKPRYQPKLLWAASACCCYWQQTHPEKRKALNSFFKRGERNTNKVPAIQGWEVSTEPSVQKFKSKALWQGHKNVHYLNHVWRTSGTRPSALKGLGLAGGWAASSWGSRQTPRHPRGLQAAPQQLPSFHAPMVGGGGW